MAGRVFTPIAQNSATSSFTICPRRSNAARSAASNNAPFSKPCQPNSSARTHVMSPEKSGQRSRRIGVEKTFTRSPARNLEQPSESWRHGGCTDDRNVDLTPRSNSPGALYRHHPVVHQDPVIGLQRTIRGAVHRELFPADRDPRIPAGRELIRAVGRLSRRVHAETVTIGHRDGMGAYRRANLAQKQVVAGAAGEGQNKNSRQALYSTRIKYFTLRSQARSPAGIFRPGTSESVDFPAADAAPLQFSRMRQTHRCRLCSMPLSRPAGSFRIRKIRGPMPRLRGSRRTGRWSPPSGGLRLI